MSANRIQRVLIVEDDAMVRRLLTRHFQKHGATVVEAADAEQALHIFQADGVGFDVVVTDVHLPARSGVDLATDFRVIKPQQPIVFVTGDVDETLARRALAGGRVGYLLKPFEFFELDAAVAQAVQNSALTPTRTDEVPMGSGSEAQWLAEQRRLLLAASQSTVDLRTLSEPPQKRGVRAGFWIKIGATVLVLVGLALLIGYGISSQEEVPPQQTPAVGESQQGRTIYVPYEAPDRPAGENRR